MFFCCCFFTVNIPYNNHILKSLGRPNQSWYFDKVDPDGSKRFGLAEQMGIDILKVGIIALTLLRCLRDRLQN